MKLSGTPVDILRSLKPEAAHAAERAKSAVREGKLKDSILPYQAAALFELAQLYDEPGRAILEIGTYYGYSAALLAMAAPKASIITLNPTPWEHEIAQRNLSHFPNVQAVCRASWDYLDTYAGPDPSMIFVDGDHKQVKRDLPWWEKLSAGGLMVFHDYSPNGSAKACPPVYRALNEFREQMGRTFDVLVVDDGGVGLAGWYKREDA